MSCKLRSIQKLRSVCSLDQKGYKCYNPSTRKLHVSRDVVFDELSSWYDAGKAVEECADDNGSFASSENAKQVSQSLSGLGESSNSRSAEKPWSGILRSTTSTLPDVSE